MKKISVSQIIGIATLGLMSAGTAVQASDDFHDPPFDFLFGNHIDAHQETNLKKNKDTGAYSDTAWLRQSFTPECIDKLQQ